MPSEATSPPNKALQLTGHSAFQSSLVAWEAWLHEYNVERPHGSLGGRVPAVFFEQWEDQNKDAA